MRGTKKWSKKKDLAKKSNGKLLKILLTIVVLFFGIRALWDWFFPVRTLNFRLEITFEVDGELVTGSGVQLYRVGRNVNPLAQGIIFHGIFGESVIVDLSNRPTIFALRARSRLDGQVVGGYNFLVQNACKHVQKARGYSPAEYVRFVGRSNGSCDITLKDLPPLMVFKDEQNPTTAARVFPDHPETTLGSGVKFVGAKLTFTDEPVTIGIEDRLTWLGDYDSRLLGGDGSLSTVPYIYFRRYRND